MPGADFSGRRKQTMLESVFADEMISYSINQTEEQKAAATLAAKVEETYQEDLLDIFKVDQPAAQNNDLDRFM